MHNNSHTKAERNKRLDGPEKPPTPPEGGKPATKIPAYDYLRAIVILLVIVHHGVLAYTTFVQPNPENPIETFSPVVDSQRWVGFDYLVGFNDQFMMHALFFISGFFIWGSLARKGAGKFLRARLARLGIPFAIGVPLLIPLALFPAILQWGRIHGVGVDYLEFWRGMAKHYFPTAGPLWFIWLLLAFNIVAAFLYIAAPGFGERIRSKHRPIFKKPLSFFGTLFGIAIGAHLALLLFFSPYEWTGIGPFVFQTSRILLYLVYFLAGAIVGAYGLDRTIFKPGSGLARSWWAWLVVSLVSYVGLCICRHLGAPGVLILLAVTIVSLSGVFAAIAIFLRFAKRRVAILDSLSANSYGIYIVHYAFVTWLQYALLDANLPAIPKALIVVAGTIALSWAFTAAIRRIPGVARVI